MVCFSTYLDFIADSPIFEVEKPYTVIRDTNHAGKSRKLSNIAWSAVDVTINDVRDHTQEFSLEKSGFQIVNHASQALPITDISKMEDYLTETKTYLKSLLGAEHVVSYDCKIRKNQAYETPTVDIGDPLLPNLPPVGLHVDSSFDFAPRIIQNRLNDEERARYLTSQYRFRIIK
ncbi:hypothetical protein N7478_002163 [Penicillium angulare]|uniref:uncharacterized protein n=1 Tax=Penicillium angulare TaxID=116970 RepID=UPI00253F6F29|nr:uncharacterized protein N7478_002163 [Penicillium angulare]KAJ5289133.1 hypothetical protein N7478_002163 [Penicillium angulare]